MSRRVWFARDTALTGDRRIQELGAEFGPAGPLVFEEILAVAKIDEEDGTVSVTYAVLASRSFVTPARAKRIVAAAAALGVIELHGEIGAKAFTASIPSWGRWQVKDPTAAARQARRRAQTSRNGHAGSHA